jgi:hypothetical protein
MKRWMVISACVCMAPLGGYFAIANWAIRHEALSFMDADRYRLVEVNIAVRRDFEMKAEAGYGKLPVAIISQGNTVKNTEYSFLANVLAARGYLVASIQHDLSTDAALMTRPGMPYVGRLAVYQRGAANILFAVGELIQSYPYADYDHLTLVGHSNGGDISVFFAKMHPELVRKIVTLDNLRVPLVSRDGLRILSFRSHDPVFKADPGVVPDNPAGTDIVQTDAQHTDMSDRGPDAVKESIEQALDKFLEQTSAPAPVAGTDADRPVTR